jgi:hypothetical protein
VHEIKDWTGVDMQRKRVAINTIAAVLVLVFMVDVM